MIIYVSCQYYVEKLYFIHQTVLNSKFIFIYERNITHLAFVGRDIIFRALNYYFISLEKYKYRYARYIYNRFLFKFVFALPLNIMFHVVYVCECMYVYVYLSMCCCAYFGNIKIFINNINIMVIYSKHCVIVFLTYT